MSIAAISRKRTMQASSIGLVMTALALAFLAVPPSAQTVSADASYVCRNESGIKVMPQTCNGTFSGGLCSGGFYQDISFSRPYSTPPKVIVTPRNISDQGGCVGGATDKLVCRADNVTTTGFRLWCYGSPEGASCSDKSGWATKASADWFALENSASCTTAGANKVQPLTCDGTNQGGLCSNGFLTEIMFEKKFDSIPHIVTTPEILSDQGGCVGGSTDKVLCRPESVTRDGFNLRCSGSPHSSCGDYEGWKTKAQAAYVAKENTEQCHVESWHDLETDVCNGTSAKNGQVCSVAWEKKVIFAKPYATPPMVIVTPENITSGGSACAQGATDKVVCHAKDVTTHGFTAVCSGSPQSGHAAYTKVTQNPPVPVLVAHRDCDLKEKLFHKRSSVCETQYGVAWVPGGTSTTFVPETECGAYEGYWTKARFGWMAIEAQCKAKQGSSSSSSVSSVSSSSVTSSVSSQPMGCIEVIKETFKPNGQLLTPTTAFTFVLDNSRIGQNNSGGYLRFDNVPVGTHTVRETVPEGWSQVLVTPSNGIVNVHAGGSCSVVVFKNKQTEVGGYSSMSQQHQSSSAMSSSVYSSSVPSSSAQSSSAMPGCIEVTKQTYNPNGVLQTPTAQFTFIVGNRIGQNDSTGKVRFDNLTPGQYQVRETVPSGWVQTHVSASGGWLTVPSGPTCAQILFKNQQVSLYSSSSAMSSSVYSSSVPSSSAHSSSSSVCQYNCYPSSSSVMSSSVYSSSVMSSSVYSSSIPSSSSSVCNYHCYPSSSSSVMSSSVSSSSMQSSSYHPCPWSCPPSSSSSIQSSSRSSSSLPCGYGCPSSVSSSSYRSSSSSLHPCGYNPCQSSSSSSSVKKYQCSDGKDNDNDGKIDRHDRGCYTYGFYNPYDNNEKNSSCKWWSCWFKGWQNANVNSNANTNVNSTINANTQNNVGVTQQGGGTQNANVNANGQTNVNSEINAGSQNNTNVWQSW